MTLQLSVFLLLYVLTEGFGYVLEFLNLRYLRERGDTVPEEFAGQIEAAQLEQVRAYTLTSTRFDILTSMFDEALTLIFIFSGLLVWYSQWIDSFKLGMVGGGVLFFIVLSLVKTGLEMPFNLYDEFGIEKRFGFNRMTPLTWVTDLLKSSSMGMIFTALLAGCSLLLIVWLPCWWWLAVWGFFFVFSIFMMYLSPYIIEPLFNKFTPIEDETLVDGIRNVLEKAGIVVKGVYKMDASRRTNHTNAYFTGIGKVKRIVLYDTLLEKLDRDEIIAVLAHEAGHCRRRHIIKLLVIFELSSLVGAYLAYVILNSGLLAWLFGLGEISFPAQLVLLFFAAGVFTWPCSPLFNLISRCFEREADAFALRIVGSGESLATALIKLSTDNLANLHPHPFYSAFYYSHPPVLERIRFLRRAAKE